MSEFQKKKTFFNFGKFLYFKTGNLARKKNVFEIYFRNVLENKQISDLMIK